MEKNIQVLFSKIDFELQKGQSLTLYFSDGWTFTPNSKFWVTLPKSFARPIFERYNDREDCIIDTSQKPGTTMRFKLRLIKPRIR